MTLYHVSETYQRAHALLGELRKLDDRIELTSDCVNGGECPPKISIGFSEHAELYLVQIDAVGVPPFLLDSNAVHAYIESCLNGVYIGVLEYTRLSDAARLIDFLASGAELRLRVTSFSRVTVSLLVGFTDRYLVTVIGEDGVRNSAVTQNELVGYLSVLLSLGYHGDASL